MASPSPHQCQQPAPMVNNAIPQQRQQQPQQGQHQVQPQPSQLQYAPQLAQASVAALQQPQVARSPSLARKPIGRKAVVPGNNTAPSPIARPNSVASASLASQQHTHRPVQVVGPYAPRQPYQNIQQATPNSQLGPIQHLQIPVKGVVVQRPTQIQHQPIQQPQLAQHRPQPQALQQLQQTQTTQHHQSAGAALTSQHHVQQSTGAMPPLPRRTTMPTLQPQQVQHIQHSRQQQPQLQQSVHRGSVQRAPSHDSTTSTGAHSVSSGPIVATPSTGPTTPNTLNLTSSQWKQAQPPSNTGRSIQQEPGPSTIFCNHCKTGIPSNVSTYTCLICSTANTLTCFCVWCFTAGAAATSHPHDKAYYVNESDLRIQLAPNSGVPTQLWTVRRNVAGTFWYTQNVSGYKTHIKPHAAVVGSAGLAPGWDERRTPDGKTFFFNSATRATSWVRPLNSLPPGWRELRTPDLVPFYVHDGMALASWERPGQQPRGRRSNMTGRQGASNASDSLKKMWGKLGKTKNLNKMARLATTVNNLADGNFEPDEGDAEGGFEEASVEEETVEEYAGEEFGGDVQQDDQTEVYVDGGAFQQLNFASQQEQPLYTDPSQAVVQQPIFEQQTYEQPFCEQANTSSQQPTYETGQQTPVFEPLAQSPLTNDSSYVIPQPQPEPSQLYVTQEPFGMTPEQEGLVQSQSSYASPAPGTLENPYQTTAQQDLMLNQPADSLAQSQVPPVHQMPESMAPTQQPAPAFTPEEQSQMSGSTQPMPQPTPPFTPQQQIQMPITSGHAPQEQQQIIVNNEVTVIEVESSVTNNTAQVIDSSQLNVTNINQTSVESSLTVDNSQSNSVHNEQEVLVDNTGFNTMNEIRPTTQTNMVDQNPAVDNNIGNHTQRETSLNSQTEFSVYGTGSEPSQCPPVMPAVDTMPSVDSAGPLPGPAIIETAQIQDETTPAVCDISSLSGDVQAINLSAPDAASTPFVFEPILAAEPMVSPPAEQNGVVYSPTII